MKKLISVLSLLAIILSLASCNTNDQDETDVEETKEIVLGDEVESVVLTTVEGEKITCNTDTDFYEIFNKVYSRGRAGEKHSYIAETKMGDNSKSFTNMDVYYPANFANGFLIEASVKKEGDDAASVIEEYNYNNTSADNKREMTTLVSYTYKDEKAFGGTVLDANGYKVYASEEYPIIPEVGTELQDMQVRAGYLRMFTTSPALFQHLESREANGKTYDFDEFVTREYKLYENYIVFKQTAPFIYVNTNAGNDPDILHAAFSNAECSITQEAYCNVQTGKIELIKVYGDTLWFSPEYWGQKMEINMEIYIHTVGEAEIQQKIDKFVEYIKSSVE
ncbi:MAG: hypothetical protein IJW52_02645 [Clostridia bacterium]|nr:hypothetical protein [Clostridia bacterium]